MTRIGSIAATVALVAAVAACSGGGAAASVTPPPGAQVVVTAQNGSFDRSDLRAPAGKRFEIFFRNLDAAPHNVAIYTDSSASTSLFSGQMINDAATVYEVPALTAGTYVFRCDVHPNMKGTFTVG